MADISKVKIGEITYNVKDSTARQEISNLQSLTTGAMHYIGTTTTKLTDGSTTNPISISGTDTTANAGDVVIYGEMEYVFNGTKWQEFGSTGSLKGLAFKDSASVTFTGGASDVVLGEATTFTNASSAVSFSGGSTADVLKSDVTATVPKATGTTKYLTASAAGTALNVSADKTALTGLGDPSQAEFVKSYPGASSKLVTDTVTWSASVSDETLSFNWTDKTVATGSLASSGTGSAVLTGLGTPTKGNAVTGYPNAASDNFVDSVSIKSQPTVTLTSGNSTSTGAVSYVSAVSNSGTNSVTFATSGHVATVVENLGTATAAAQKITVGTNDKVTAVTDIGTGTAQ